ncbi:hypothetical protein RRG08_020315 [Elysia crispata]|uniref:Uncharacterized protein n=1 Tax=Elysia crispata TaxID=231223 RepID=A0AAE1CVX7_9GAST|nr:hypothetical protein RRG08_020315 [Elysia crispata]
MPSKCFNCRAHQRFWEGIQHVLKCRCESMEREENFSSDFILISFLSSICRAASLVLRRVSTSDPYNYLLILYLRSGALVRISYTPVSDSEFEKISAKTH